MIQHTMVVGPFQCNCTILACERTREAIVIDAGDELKRIQDWLAKQRLAVKYSVHTHAHLDHIGAVGGLKAAIPSMRITLHRADGFLYEMLPMQGRMFGMRYDAPPPVDRFVEEAETIAFGDHHCSVIHTPGHSPGGICLKFKEGALAPEPVLFSGDTLFQGSVGRTDLWGGDYGALIGSIKDRLLTLDEETIVMPGHGPRTTIASEARKNPFLA